MKKSAATSSISTKTVSKDRSSRTPAKSTGAKSSGAKPKKVVSELPRVKKSSDDFFERVWEIVAQVPRGRVTTYGDIARALGAGSSSRMVGWAMNAAHAQPWIPAHRVINRLGELSGKMHFETPTRMRELLEAEGIEFDGERVPLQRYLWIPSVLAD